MAGFKDCILDIYRETFQLEVFLSCSSEELVMKGSKEGVRRCRDDVQHTLATLRWWYQQDEETAPPKVSEGTKSDSRQASGQKNFQTVETCITNDNSAVTETVFIEPKYQRRVIGDNECVLRELKEKYNVTVLFNEFTNKIIINGVREKVKLCKADVDLNMSVRRWHDEARRLANIEEDDEYCDEEPSLKHVNKFSAHLNDTKEVITSRVFVEPQYR